MTKKKLRSSNTPVYAQPFPLARLALVMCISLVAYASLTPLEFHARFSVGPLEWFFAPLPKYIPLFDVSMNIIGYIPFGFLCIFALYPTVKKWRALILVVFLGLLLSAILESIQTYLPSRISSQVDWYSNGLGALLGGLFALPLSPAWLSGNVAERFRASIFDKHRGFFLMAILFPWCQMYPQNAWLGMGDFNFTSTRLSPYWDFPLNNASQELLITTTSVVATAAFFLFGTRRNSPQIRLLILLFAFTIIVKLFLTKLQFGASGWEFWWNNFVLSGLVGGAVISWRVKNLGPNTLWWIAFMGLCILVLFVNLLPHNPFYASQLEMLHQGRIANFNGLLQWLSLMWPFLALFLLLKDRKIQMISK